MMFRFRFAFAQRLAACVVILCAPLGAAADFARDWRVYKANFLTEDGRIIDTGNDGISHTEGQGTGMLFAALADDRAAFDAMWAWTQEHLARPDAVFAWKWDPASEPRVPDLNNATDGDLLIAWALLEAYAQWGEAAHREAAQAIAAALEAQAVRRGTGFVALKPAVEYFALEDGIVLNPSYYVFAALRALAERTGRPLFADLYRDGLLLLERAAFGAEALPPDWMTLSDAGEMALWDKRPPRFGYEAIRVPLYLIWAGECDVPAVARVKAAWDRRAPAGAPPPSFIDFTGAEIPGYRASAGFLAVRALVDACSAGEMSGAGVPALSYGEDYYGASLVIFARLAAIANGWER